MDKQSGDSDLFPLFLLIFFRSKHILLLYVHATHGRRRAELSARFLLRVVICRNIKTSDRHHFLALLVQLWQILCSVLGGIGVYGGFCGKVIHTQKPRKNGKSYLYTNLSTLSTWVLWQLWCRYYGNLRNGCFVKFW